MRPALVASVLLLASCTRIYTGDQNQSANGGGGSPIAPTPIAATVIEFRVLGNVGTALASIRFSTSTDGLTVVSGVGLPYVASLSTRDSQTFLFIQATALSNLFVEGTLQAQIFVNGKLFREGFATGFNQLTATASGTWRRE